MNFPRNFDRKFIRKFAYSEMVKIQRAAEHRRRKHASSSVRVDAINPLRSECVGVASEICVGEWLRVPTRALVDLEGGDGGEDARVRGRIVNVKSSARDFADLTVPPWEVVVPDQFYVLCVRCAPSTIAGVGWILGEEYFGLSVVKDMRRGVGPQRVVPPDRLHSLRALVRLADQGSVRR